MANTARGRGRRDVEGVRVPIGAVPVAKKGGLKNNGNANDEHQPGIET